MHGGRREMARMLGEGFLPEPVQQRRRQFREKVQEVRNPIRSKRQKLVPGPDIIGKVESRAMDLRQNIVSREGLLDQIQMRRDSGGGSNTENKSNSGNNKRQFQNITT